MEPLTIGALAVAALAPLGGVYLASRTMKPRPAVPMSKSTTIPEALLKYAEAVRVFYRQKGYEVMPFYGQVGYQVSSLKCHCILTPKISLRHYERVARDLEFFLNNRGKSCQNLSVRGESGYLMIRWNHPAKKQVNLSQLMRKYPPTPHSYVIGVTDDMKPIRLPLDRESPHVIVLGITGSGKTIALIDLVVNALEVGQKVIVCNHKPRPDNNNLGLWDFEGTVPYYGDFVSIRQAFEHIAVDMRGHQNTLLVVDEAAALLTADPELAEPLGTIAQMGRDFDIHVALASSQLTKATLQNAMLLQNIGTSIIGLRMASNRQSYLGTGIPEMGLHELGGRGDARVRIHSRITRCQIAWPNRWHLYLHPIERTIVDLDPSVTVYLDSKRGGERVSIAELQRTAQEAGRGREWHFWKRQFDLAVERGLIAKKDRYQPGRKV